MTNVTIFDPIALKTWCSREESSQLLQEQLEQYFQNYDSIFRTKPQRKLFQTFLQGLLSTLDRKSIEPIALHFLGEDRVRSLQQFLTRSPFDDEKLLNTYQKLLSVQIGSCGGMLSVDDTSFVKKGEHSIGVKRQYCGRLGKTENCQVGVFLAYAGTEGYGLVDDDLYIPQEWFDAAHADLREECHLPETKTFATKNKIALDLLNRALGSGLFPARWVGCDAAYGTDHEFLDRLELPEQVWYFAATNAKEQIFLEYPELLVSNKKKGRPRKHPILSHAPVCVKEIAEDSAFPWESVVLAEGAKGPILAERKVVRCFSCRKDGSRNYVKPGAAIWLYLRKYADGSIKYFVSNAPEDLSVKELDDAATLRWPIEQCFEECKGNLGMGDYECRSYPGWKRHMLFVMIAHLFTIQIRKILKKKQSQ